MCPVVLGSAPTSPAVQLTFDVSACPQTVRDVGTSFDACVTQSLRLPDAPEFGMRKVPGISVMLFAKRFPVDWRCPWTNAVTPLSEMMESATAVEVAVAVPVTVLVHFGK
jgi:hypothetical protein